MNTDSKFCMRRSVIAAFIIFSFAISPHRLHAAETLEQKATTALQQAHISKIDWQGKSVWIKGVEPYKKTPWHCYKKKLGQWFAPKPLFTPTVACGNQMITLEKERLALFEQRGVHVPMLIGSAENWLALEDLGESLELRLNQATPEKRVDLLFQALNTLIDLHHKGLAHGRAMVKDMVVMNNGNIGFIDLAEDPQRYMTIDQAQARDFLLFLFSSIPFIKQDLATQQKLIAHYMKHTLPTVRQEIQETFIFLKVPYILTYYFHHFLKVDGQRAFDAYTALKEYYAKMKGNLKREDS